MTLSGSKERRVPARRGGVSEKKRHGVLGTRTTPAFPCSLSQAWVFSDRRPKPVSRACCTRSVWPPAQRQPTPLFTANQRHCSPPANAIVYRQPTPMFAASQDQPTPANASQRQFYRQPPLHQICGPTRVKKYFEDLQNLVRILFRHPPTRGWYFSLSARRLWKGRSNFSRTIKNGPAFCVYKQLHTEVPALFLPPPFPGLSLPVCPPFHFISSTSPRPFTAFPLTCPLTFHCPFPCLSLTFKGRVPTR